MVPLGQRVRAIGDRLLTVRLDVVVCGRVHREERRVAKAAREVRLRLGQLDGEGLVVDNFEALELLALLEALDRLEVVRAEQRVFYRVVPCVDEVLGGHCGAVGPLRVLQGDAVACVAFRLDGLGDIVLHFAVAVVIDQACEDLVDDAAATGLVDVARYERVLRLRAVDKNVVVATAGGAFSATICRIV